MKYTYKYGNGEVQTIEISEEMFSILTNEDRIEYNNNQTNSTRSGRFVSLDMTQDEEGMQFADPRSLPLTEAELRIQCAIEMLEPDQRAMIQAIYYKGMTASEYARQQGVSQPAVSQRLKTAQKKLKKILLEPYI